MRFSIVIVGFAALALAACGGSGGTAAASHAGRPSTAPSGAGQGGVAGQITQVGAATLVVKEPAGDVSVGYSTTTSVLQTSGATQSNILAGACVVVMGQREPAGTVTADMVQVQFNMNGNCTPPPGVSPGGNGPGNAVNLRGKIVSVSGGSFVTQPIAAGSAPVTVNVPATARITRLDTATTAKLAVGQCVRVNGQRGGGGVVQARAVVITLPGPSGCAGPTAAGQPSASPGA
jgi:hypothetical protein